MQESLTELLTLVKDKYGGQLTGLPLIRAFIDRIAQAPLPKDAYRKLDILRNNFAPEETFSSASQKVFNLMGTVVGTKVGHEKAKSKPQVNAVAAPAPPPAQYVMAQQPQAIPVFVNMPQQQQQQAPPPPQQQQQPSSGNKGNGSKGKDNGKKVSQGEPKKKYESKFVAPWPETSPYLNESGSNLAKDFEDHFRGYCFRCGHSSHRGNDCRTYPEKTAIMTLCGSCRQGLHETCRSRRKDLQVKSISEQVREAYSALGAPAPQFSAFGGLSACYPGNPLYDFYAKQMAMAQGSQGQGMSANSALLSLEDKTKQGN